MSNDKGLYVIEIRRGKSEKRMPPRLDKEANAERVQIVAPRSWLDLIEEWRSKRRPIPSQSAAIRQLVEIGLEAERERGKR